MSRCQIRKNLCLVQKRVNPTQGRVFKQKGTYMYQLCSWEKSPQQGWGIIEESSLVAQWLRIHLSMQEARVRSLVRKLRSYLLRSG